MHIFNNLLGQEIPKRNAECGTRTQKSNCITNVWKNFTEGDGEKMC